MKLVSVVAGVSFCLLSNAVGQNIGILPSQVLDLTSWKLTLPIGSPGAPTEILQPALGAFVDVNYFYVNTAGSGVVFTAPCGGVTTSGSSYPRSELREMSNNGSTTASWSSASGTSTMEITEAITHTPVAKPQVIAGQVHDARTKVVDCRLNGSELFIENASGGVDAVLTTGYQLGTVFTIKFVAASGGIAVYYNGNYIYTHSVSESGLYFKAGAYTQSNPSHGDSPTAYGQVVIYSLHISHTGAGSGGGNADLAAACSAPSGLVLGNTLTYQIAITNQGPATASNVLVSDTLPAAALFLSATGGGVANNGVVTWPVIAALPVGGRVNYSVVVSPPASGLLTNLVSTTASNLDPSATNNTATVVNAVGPSADLAVFATGPATAPTGTNASYTIIVTNLGPSAATNVLVMDILSSNAVFVSASGGGSYSRGSISWPAVSSLADGAALSFTVTATLPSAGLVTNRAAATSITPDPNPGDSDGSSATVTSVNNPAAVTASFAVNPSSGKAPLTVQFTDQSTGPVTAWNWSFGDGVTSTSQSPSHTYTSAGSFIAQLTVTGGGGQTNSVNHTIIVTNIPPVTASFAVNPSSGMTPLTVQFTDQSTGPVTVWNWNFGDGATSASRNPTHTYASPGIFTAQLIVTGSSGQNNNVSHTITVTNVSPVIASFAVNPSSGQAPLTVQFADQSIGAVISWNWNFGDGGTSTLQNPSHTYANAGSFTAQLTVTGSSGQNNSTSHTITVTSNSAAPVFGILAGNIVLSTQTGLFDQSVMVTNAGSAAVAGVRLLVGGLRSGARLYNANGTNATVAYEQYNQPVTPGQTVTFLLEFYVPDRGPIADTLQAEAVASTSVQPISGSFGVSRILLDTNSPAAMRVAIEINTIPGHSYTVIYSDDGMVTWHTNAPPFTAGSAVSQWYDGGPPATASDPASVSSRFYRVIDESASQ